MVIGWLYDTGFFEHLFSRLRHQIKTWTRKIRILSRYLNTGILYFVDMRVDRFWIHLALLLIPVHIWNLNIILLNSVSVFSHFHFILFFVRRFTTGNQLEKKANVKLPLAVEDKKKIKQYIICTCAENGHIKCECNSKYRKIDWA